MQDIERLLNNVNKLDINDVFFDLWSDNKVQKYAISLLTKGEKTSQLYELGQDGDGVFIGEYAESTIQGTSNFEGKISKGQRYDHVTLSDSFDYYETFVMLPNKKGFEITDNPMKDGKDITERYGNINVTKLQKENKDLLIGFIESDFNKELEKRLFQ
jgi:hypothetical protein